MQRKMKLPGFILLILISVSGLIRADAFIKLPSKYYGIGPGIGYSSSANLGGWTVSFDAATISYGLALSAGFRYTFTESANDFKGNKGLLALYSEITLPLFVGLGASYNFALGSDSGFGLHAVFHFPFPAGKANYLSFFYRPKWLWLGGKSEVINEFGFYLKFSNMYAENAEQARKRYEERMKRYREKRKKTKRKYKEDKIYDLFKKNKLNK